MSAVIEDRPFSTLPRNSPPAAVAGLPSFNFPPRDPSLDPSSQQKTPTQASFDAAAATPSATALHRTSASSPTVRPYRSDSNRDRINAHRTNASLESIQSDVKTEDRDSGDDSDASTSRPSKKKKGQRFYCTDYPPCNLSFTRSEHLARHIRKHTGERPFQCHCMRRFSRLDNLRQHAQTVHVNEDIPGDSLAATGTRFQRQVRTDRVKTHRNRGSTLNSPTAHSRGHSRNMSGSSIGSASDIAVTDDLRRRPPPLAMAQGTPPRSGLALDIYAANAQGPDAPYYNYSPSGYSTPMSVYSADVGSPAAPPLGLNSPMHCTPRSQWDGRSSAHARRLSVPTQPSLFHQAALSAAGNAPYASFIMQGQPPFSPIASSLASPASSTFPDSRQEGSSPAETVWKRRTWHPSTTLTGPRPATSGLSFYQTPDTPQPIPATQPAAQQSIRLPGIDSFDRAHVQPTAPPRRPPSNLEAEDGTPRDSAHSHAGSDAGSKRNSWASISQHMTHMDIAAPAPPGDGPWQPAPPHSAQRPFTAPYGSMVAPAGTSAIPPSPMEPSLRSSPNPASPHRVQTQFFSSEPGPALVDESPTFRTSPDGSASSDNLPTPGNGPLSGQNPLVMHSNASGEVPPAHLVDEVSRDKIRVQAAHPPMANLASPATHLPYPISTAQPMSGLDTLAAVAEQERR